MKPKKRGKGPDVIIGKVDRKFQGRNPKTSAEVYDAKTEHPSNLVGGMGRTEYKRAGS